MAEFLGVAYDGIPFGTAPGAINGTNKEQILAHIRDLAESPAGIIAYGSIGSRLNEGNGGETYFHDPVSGETLNSMGLPGVGIDDAEAVIQEASQICAGEGKAFLVSISTLSGEKAHEVLPGLMERVAEAGGEQVRVEANFSCPNIVTAGGGRKLIVAYDLEAMDQTRAAIIDKMGTDFAYLEKLSPYLGEYASMIPDVTARYRPARRLGRVGVSGFNTLPAQTLERNGKPVLRIVAFVDGEEVITHAGGLSGPVMTDTIYELQKTFVEQLPHDVAFVASNGVYDGREVLRRTSGRHAADVALGVTRFWEGERVGRSYGATAALVAQEYSEALEVATDNW